MILPWWDGKLLVEYGLMPWLTVGLDGYEAGYTYGHVIGFARVPLAPAHWKTRVAGEIGFGQYHDAQGQWQNMAKATLSAGRGGTTRWGNGWAAADLAIEHRPSQRSALFKVDATVGLSSGPKLRPLLKLETGYMSGDPLIWAVTPAIMIPLPEGRTWVMGVEQRSVSNLTATGLKIELWWDF
jgi:hypothetical protein